MNGTYGGLKDSSTVPPAILILKISSNKATVIFFHEEAMEDNSEKFSVL